MKRIRVADLRVQASVGILPHELESRQQLLISMEVELGTAAWPPAEDSVAHVLDYRQLRELAIRHASAGHINMLETLAARLLADLLVLRDVTRAEVSITKPNIFPDCDGVTVTLASTAP
jgi:7,8-dihydroneopterin aldolase/epimerase/oxygenase